METKVTFAEAFLAAQKELKEAPKDRENPFFHSRYATLSSVWEAAKEALHKHDIAVIQSPDIKDGAMVLITTLVHSSGGSWQSIYPIKTKDDANPQLIGSAVTYARRYALAAMIGVMVEDDDGEAAAAPAREKTAMPNTQTKDNGESRKTSFFVKEVKSYQGTSKSTGKAYTNYSIVSEDGIVFSTFRKEDADLARESIDNKMQVVVTYTQNGKFMNATRVELDEEQVPFG